MDQFAQKFPATWLSGFGVLFMVKDYYHAFRALCGYAVVQLGKVLYDNFPYLIVLPVVKVHLPAVLAALKVVMHHGAAL